MNYKSQKLVLFFIFSLVIGCSDIKIQEEYPYEASRTIYKSKAEADKREKLFGDKLTFKSTRHKVKQTETSIDKDNIDKDKKSFDTSDFYLWRAAIDTLSFMRIERADSSEGIIHTYWYNDPSDDTQRIRASLIITDRKLAIESLRLVMEKDVRVDDRWVRTMFEQKKINDIEDVILNRAIELKNGH